MHKLKCLGGQRAQTIEEVKMANKQKPQTRSNFLWFLAPISLPVSTRKRGSFGVAESIPEPGPHLPAPRDRPGASLRECPESPARQGSRHGRIDPVDLKIECKNYQIDLTCVNVLLHNWVFSVPAIRMSESYGHIELTAKLLMFQKFLF